MLVVVQVVGQYSQGVGNHSRSSLRQNSFDRLIFRVVKSDFERVVCSRFSKERSMRENVTNEKRSFSFCENSEGFVSEMSASTFK